MAARVGRLRIRRSGCSSLRPLPVGVRCRATAGQLRASGGGGTGRDRRRLARGHSQGAPADGRQLAFGHALVRRRSSGPSRLHGGPDAHRCVAAALSERAQRAPERWLAALAHHALAGASDDAEPALAYALDAARHAVERLAWEDAIVLLARAEALASRTTAAGPSGSPRCSSRSARPACAPARAMPAVLCSRRRPSLARPLRARRHACAAALGAAGRRRHRLGRRVPGRAPQGSARPPRPAVRAIAGPAPLPACDRTRLRHPQEGRRSAWPRRRSRAHARSPIPARSRPGSPPRMSRTGRPSIRVPASLPPMSS